VEKAWARSFVMRSDHNLVEPVTTAIAKFMSSATVVLRNILALSASDRGQHPFGLSTSRVEEVPSDKTVAHVQQFPDAEG
jgi:hypothetical protein